MFSLNPSKYDGKPAGDLRKALLRRDAEVITEKTSGSIQASRTRRLGTAAVSSVVLEALLVKYPSLKSLGGLPIGLDHLAALGGAAAAYMLTDGSGSTKAVEENAEMGDYAEGFAMSGLVPLMRQMTAKGMAVADTIL